MVGATQSFIMLHFLLREPFKELSVHWELSLAFDHTPNTSQSTAAIANTENGREIRIHSGGTTVVVNLNWLNIGLACCFHCHVSLP